MKIKLMAVLIALLLASCGTRIEEQSIRDFGRKKIGEGLYLKKLYIGDVDRVYLVVDENDRLAGSCSTTSITISDGETTHTESATIITK